MPVTEEKSRPRADDSHDTPGRANDLGCARWVKQPKGNNAGAGTESRNQIAQGEAQRANGSFQARSENIERKQIEKKMGDACVKKQRGK